GFVDLDAARVKIEHRGQAGHHAEAAAPFAEESTGRGRRVVQGVEHAVGPREVAGDETGDEVVALEALDAALGFAQERAHVAWQHDRIRRDWDIRQRHGRTLSLRLSPPGQGDYTGPNAWFLEEVVHANRIAARPSRLQLLRGRSGVFAQPPAGAFHGTDLPGHSAEDHVREPRPGRRQTA